MIASRERGVSRGDMGFHLLLLSGCKAEAGLDGEGLEAGGAVGRPEFRGEMLLLGLWWQQGSTEEGLGQCYLAGRSLRTCPTINCEA